MRRNQILLSSMLVVVIMFFSDIPASASPILSVDFQQSGFSTTETGFFALAGTNPDSTLSTSTGRFGTFSTSEGDITVTLSVAGTAPGFFDRVFVSPPASLSDSGAFTYAQLYNDFVYSNHGGTISIDLSGPGIKSEQIYDITLWSYGNPGFGNQEISGEFRPDATTGTTGAIISYLSDPNLTPTANLDYGFSGSWSTSTGTLGIDAVWLSTGGVDPGSGGQTNRVNGIQVSLAPVPEPGTLILLGSGLAGMFAFRKKIRRPV